MINRNRWMTLGMSAAACAVMALLAAGCGGSDDNQVAQAPPPPPPPSAPPPPPITPIAKLMTMLNIDPRVNLPEDKAPDNDVDRKAVLVFFDAFARGDAKSVKGMLPLTDQLELAALVDSGAWKDTVGRIQSIDVQTGSNTLGQKCALAVFEVASGAVTNFQPQLWYYTADARTALFDAAPTPPGIMDKLSGDWIAAWHKVLADELAMAERAEVAWEPPKKNLDPGDKPDTAVAGGGPKGLAPAPEGTAPPPSLPEPGGR